MPGRMRSIILPGMVLVIVTAALYVQTGNFEFINLDDNLYVTNNPHVASGISGENIAWAFSTFDYSYWHPVTWLSHMVDVQLFGMNPRGHHLTNVCIHTASSLLLLILLFRLTGGLWRSFVVAALFALHPTHVESVAWVAERKDVLSALFWFLTLLMYAEFTAKRRPLLYILSLCSFMLGLMSKPMLVTLPVVMLLVDFWPLGCFPAGDTLQQTLRRGRTLLYEKIPFLACSLFSGLVTIYGQYKFGAMSDLTVFPFQLRVENALVSYSKYIIATFRPLDLAVFYPFPVSIPFWQITGSLGVLVILSAAVVTAGRRHPYCVAGWFWFLISLVPVIGLTQVGNQSMADRFAYIPGIGLFIIVVWGVEEATRGLRYRKGILALLAGTAIAASFVLSWQQLGYWRDSVSLCRHSIQVTTGNKNLIYSNLGAALIEKGDMDGAILAMREALAARPDFVDAHHILGIALSEKGDFDGAIREYLAALRINTNDAKLHFNLGVALANTADLDSAAREFRTVLQIHPNDIGAHSNLGAVLARKGDLDAATEEFRKVLLISPGDAFARSNLDRVLARKGAK